MKKMLFAGIAVAMCCISSNVLAATWTIPGDFPTIQSAVNSALVIQGDKLQIGPGSHAGALLTKSVTITGEDGATINSGPMHPAGLSQGFRLLTGSEGATINHLKFEVDLAIMNGDGVDLVTIDHCTFVNSMQAISNWRGSGWQISHNNINDLRCRNGGGIGILIADRSGGTVEDNVVSHNKVSGTLHVPATGESGGYAGSGIVIFADFRWGQAGSQGITYNRVVKNHVSLISDNTNLVDVVAFELTEARDETSPAVIKSNSIGFNDFRGTETQVTLTPTTLDTVNTISRNLGENRGKGSHPKVFGPNS